MKHLIVNSVYEAKGNSLKANELIKEYLPFIKSETYKAVGHIISDSSDELSIAMIAFHEAIESYNKLKGAFLKYSSVIIKRKLIDYYRKERKHLKKLSLDENIYNEDDNIALIDSIRDTKDDYEIIHMRDATKEEILELTNQLSYFGISLTDISDSSPKQNRTLKSCWEVLYYIKNNPEMMQQILISKKLPISAISLATGVSKKTLERHRKYILAIVVIHSNGYEIIRGHLKEVLYKKKEKVI